MAISVFDFTKGIDFTALANGAAADHNTLVDAAVPFATDKGIVMVSNDIALNTPVVPNPNAGATFTKWKNYIWLRRPFNTATDTTPYLYVWNENAVSVVTYLKWQRVKLDTTDLQALITALTLRVEDLEASTATILATANAANATASIASTNATAALNTANTANTNATTALSDLNTPTTGVKDRVTALETRVTAVESNITAINTSITTINNTLSSGIGPVFVAPVLLYTGTAGQAYTTMPLAIPSGAKAVILQVKGEHNGDVTLTGRKDALSSDYTIMNLQTNDAARPAYRTAQVMLPLNAASFQLFVPVTSGTTTVQMIGYYI